MRCDHIYRSDRFSPVQLIFYASHVPNSAWIKRHYVIDLYRWMRLFFSFSDKYDTDLKKEVYVNSRAVKDMDEYKIQADINSDKVEYGIAKIRSYSQQERTLNAFKTLGLFWGLAVLSVFLPVLHFVLVPLFLILGIVLALKKQNLSYQLESGEIKCPGCGTLVHLNSSSFQDFHSEICQSCAVVLRVKPTENKV